MKGRETGAHLLGVLVNATAGNGARTEGLRDALLLGEMGSAGGEVPGVVGSTFGAILDL